MGWITETDKNLECSCRRAYLDDSRYVFVVLHIITSYYMRIMRLSLVRNVYGLNCFEVEVSFCVLDRMHCRNRVSLLSRYHTFFLALLYPSLPSNL